MSRPVDRVLDKGEIELLHIMGDELTIVNSARVSFGKRKSVFEEEDRRLLKYLITHHHTSPFRHVFFQFRIKAPEFVLRQWFKHVVGSEWTSSHPSQLHGWNEISGRYVVMDEYYIPEQWRSQGASLKQGSDGVLPADVQSTVSAEYEKVLAHINNVYRSMLDQGVAREMARCILPLSIYSETMWTTSLQALLHFIDLRRSPTTQQELREYALVIERIVEDSFPETLRLWREQMV